MNNPVSIVADIGGTHARFAFITPDSDALQGVESFPCADFVFLEEAIRAYLSHGHVESASELCLAVAGPVENDWVDLPNNHWAFSQQQLQQSLNLPLNLINDFTAQALCIDSLSSDELDWLGDARPSGQHVKAILGPGTGLGVAAILPGGAVVPSEGGHIAFAPLDEHQAALLEVLWQRYPRVSVERLLSGAGLANLYWANCRLAGHDRELPAPEVTAGAIAGDPFCLQAVEDFCAVLAAVAGDIALMMGALDGVYLSGGILPRLPPLFNAKTFRAIFETKGRFSELCQSIPVGIITAPQPGLSGCVQALKDRQKNMTH